MTLWPLTVLLEPLEREPWPVTRDWASLCRSVSDVSEAKSLLVEGALSHLPWNRVAAALPPKCFQKPGCR